MLDVTITVLTRTAPPARPTACTTPRSAEFKDKYAKATTNAALVDQHLASLADVLVHFSESPENVAALVGTIQDGISYLPYTGH